MITSESNSEEICRFVRMHHEALFYNMLYLLNKKYSHSLIKRIQRGQELPTIFGSLKVGDITFYTTPIGLRKTKRGIEIEDLGIFLIMRDLRKQTRVMVTDTEPNPIIYDTHAISRYKERTGLDGDMDFVDVCKDMFLAGCGCPVGIVNNDKVYGTNTNCRVAKAICAKGVFIGYISSETDIFYGTTFLSPNELRDDQEYLDVDKNPYIIKEYWENFTKSEREREEKSDNAWDKGIEDISIVNGKVKILSPVESKAEEERFKKTLEENPSFFEDQVEINRSRAINRIRRKGFR